MFWLLLLVFEKMRNYENRALQKNAPCTTFGTRMKWRNKVHFTFVRCRVGRMKKDFFVGTVRMIACVIAVQSKLVETKTNAETDDHYGATMGVLMTDRKRKLCNCGQGEWEKLCVRLGNFDIENLILSKTICPSRLTWTRMVGSSGVGLFLFFYFMVVGDGDIVIGLRYLIEIIIIKRICRRLGWLNEVKSCYCIDQTLPTVTTNLITV